MGEECLREREQYVRRPEVIKGLPYGSGAGGQQREMTWGPGARQPSQGFLSLFYF